MSFSFDFPLCSSYLPQDVPYSGLDTPPLTPLYSTSQPTWDYLLPLPLPDLPVYPSPPTTPALTPSYPTPTTTYSCSPSYPGLSPTSYPTLLEEHRLTSSHSGSHSFSPPTYSNASTCPSLLDSSSAQPYTSSATSSLDISPRPSFQRYSPYQRSAGGKMKKPSPLRPSPIRPTTYVAPPPPPSLPSPPTLPLPLPTPLATTPSLLEQAASLITQPSPPSCSPPSDLSSPAETSSTSSPDPLLKPLARRRKARVELNDNQKTQLELVFSLYKYLGHDVRLKVAEQVGLPEKTVLYWFQNRRAKEKRDRKSKSS